MQLLVASISFTILFFFLPFAAQDTHIQVNGVLGKSLRLSSNWTLAFAVEEIRWIFKTRESSSLIAEFKNSKFDIYATHNRNRIETSRYGTELLIRDLREEDGGVYQMIIVLTDKKTKEFLFNVTIYGPVPSPVMKHDVEKKTAVWCNFTLHCSVPFNTSTLSISWLCGYKDSERCPFNQTVYDNDRSAARFSLPPESWDLEIMCLVQNPTDQKYASINTKTICSASEDKSNMTGHRYYVWPFIALVALLLMPVAFIIWKRKRKEGYNAGIREIPSGHDVQYLDVQTTIRRERDRNVEEEDDKEASNHKIVYSVLQLHQLSSPT